MTYRTSRQVLRQGATCALSDEPPQPAWIGDEGLCEPFSEADQLEVVHATLSMPSLCIEFHIEFHGKDSCSEQLRAFGLLGRESTGASCGSACRTRLCPRLLERVFRQISVHHKPRSLQWSTKIRRAYFLLCCARPERLTVTKAALCALVTSDLPIRCLQRACLPGLQLTGAVWLQCKGQRLDPYAFLDLWRVGAASYAASYIRSATCGVPGNSEVLSFVLKQVLLELLGMRWAWHGSLNLHALLRSKCCWRSIRRVFSAKGLIKLKLRKYDLLRLLSGRKCSVQRKVWSGKRGQKLDGFGVLPFSELQCLADRMSSLRCSGWTKPCEVKSANRLQKEGFSFSLGGKVLMAGRAPVDCGLFALISARDVQRPGACASCVTGQSGKPAGKPAAWKLPLLPFEQVMIMFLAMYTSSRTGY